MAGKIIILPRIIYVDVDIPLRIFSVHRSTDIGAADMGKAAKRQAEVSFDCSRADRALIGKIVARAKTLNLILPRYDAITCTMDVIATHCNGNPLRLADLLKADDFNFMHDIVGIARHINRETGELGGFFSPRFSKRVSK